jgi:DNA-directed RNA polymerase subunit beta
MVIEGIDDLSLDELDLPDLDLDDADMDLEDLDDDAILDEALDLGGDIDISTEADDKDDPITDIVDISEMDDDDM